MEFFAKIFVLVWFIGNATGSAIYVENTQYGLAVFHGFIALWMLSILHRIDD